MKNILFITLFLFSASVVFSQEIVTNIRATFSDTIVYVFYDLKKSADVELYVSLNNGDSFWGPLKNVTGNVGKNQVHGNGKVILWEAHKEFGDFESDKVKFKIVTDEHNGNSLQNTTNWGHFDKHSYVDLGLPSGTLWATCNVGANSPEEYGNYYAWGEIVSKKSSNISNYTYLENPTNLPASADVATKLSNGWRMPTKKEMAELKNYCKVTSSTINNTNGLLFTGPNGNSIFLPFAGYRSGSELLNAGFYGFYWTSSINTEDKNSVWYLDIGSDKTYISTCYREYGRSIRPVRSQTK